MKKILILTLSCFILFSCFGENEKKVEKTFDNNKNTSINEQGFEEVGTTTKEGVGQEGTSGIYVVGSELEQDLDKKNQFSESSSGSQKIELGGKPK